MDVDAIVNSTNETLSDRGGVCGHILAAAGHALISECLESEGCRTGEATITGAGRLHAKCVAVVGVPLPTCLCSCGRSAASGWAGAWAAVSRACHVSAHQERGSHCRTKVQRPLQDGSGKRASQLLP